MPQNLWFLEIVVTAPYVVLVLSQIYIYVIDTTVCICIKYTQPFPVNRLLYISLDNRFLPPFSVLNDYLRTNGPAKVPQFVSGWTKKNATFKTTQRLTVTIILYFW